MKVKPLYDILSSKSTNQKGARSSKERIKWKEENNTLLIQMLDFLVSPEVMAFPDFDKEFILHCDASTKGLGAVLYQEIDKKLKVISYASRTLNQAEKNYHLHSGKLEFLALKWAVCDRFKDYLYYAPKFTVFTDNNPLSYVLTTSKLNATGMRWITELSQYNFTIRYRPGKQAVDCDFLSRYPHEFTEVISPEDVTTTKTKSNPAVEINSCATSLSKHMIAEEQENDQSLIEIYKAVKMDVKPSKREKKRWHKESRMLVRQWNYLEIENDILKISRFNNKVLVLPKNLRDIVYKELHVKMGHVGTEKVYQMAKRRFYWPGMFCDIKEFVTQKCECIKSKAPNIQQKAPLVPIVSS